MMELTQEQKAVLADLMTYVVEVARRLHGDRVPGDKSVIAARENLRRDFAQLDAKFLDEIMRLVGSHRDSVTERQRELALLACVDPISDLVREARMIAKDIGWERTRQELVPRIQDTVLLILWNWAPVFETILSDLEADKIERALTLMIPIAKRQHVKRKLDDKAIAALRGPREVAFAIVGRLLGGSGIQLRQARYRHARQAFKNPPLPADSQFADDPVRTVRFFSRLLKVRPRQLKQREKRGQNGANTGSKSARRARSARIVRT